MINFIKLATTLAILYVLQSILLITMLKHAQLVTVLVKLVIMELIHAHLAVDLGIYRAIKVLVKQSAIKIFLSMLLVINAELVIIDVKGAQLLDIIFAQFAVLESFS